MRARLKAKLERWKSIALSSTRHRKRLGEQLRRARWRNERLEAEVAALRAAAAPLPVSGHVYPAGSLNAISLPTVRSYT